MSDRPGRLLASGVFETTPASSRTVPVPPAGEPGSPAVPAGRLQALDAYRGLIMVSLAFNGFGLAATARNHLEGESGSGFWRVVSAQFSHVQWVGCGYWDMIQPSFMFMVGVSMAFSYVKRRSAGHPWGRMFGHAAWRAAVLIVLGIFLISDSRKVTEWSLTNVLTQIGLGYPFLFLLWGRSPRFHALTAAALLLGTWMLYTFYPAAGLDPASGAPGVGVSSMWAQQHLARIGPAWHKNANVGYAIDTWLLNLLPRREPFAFNFGGYPSINFIPSLATMLFGLMAGELLRSSRTPRRKLLLLVAAGFAGLALGGLWSWFGCPLIKRLWTPSWALFSTGWCILILVAFYAVLDVWKWRSWSFPLLVVGMNSIAIYCMGMLLRGWTARTFQIHFGGDVFNLLGTANAPFVHYTLVGMIFWLICWWMYRRRIFLRI